MSKFKHTPGPWKAHTFGKRGKIYGDGRPPTSEVCLPLGDYDRAADCVNAMDAHGVVDPGALGELIAACMEIDNRGSSGNAMDLADAITAVRFALRRLRGE